MSELHSIIKDYVAFASELPIDRSVLKHPELIPLCKELGVTYDQAINTITERSPSSSFCHDLITLVMDQMKMCDEDAELLHRLSQLKDSKA